MNIRIIRWLSALVGLSLLITLAFVPAQARGDAQTFSGQATVIKATTGTTVPGTTTTLVDTGPLPSSGGALEASLLTATVDGLSAELLHAATVGQGNASRAEASVASLNLTVGGNTISADFLMARAMAECNAGGAFVSGSSEIVGLVINGQSIVVGTQPNETIPLLVGQVVINEQSGSANGQDGAFTVNALHITVTGIADIIVSSAHADIDCAGNPPCIGDFVTGGGWITGTPSAAKATFGVAGGIKNGAFWGHLTYIDHGSGGPNVKGTGVTAYTVKDAVSRHIEGTCEINGQGGYTYKVDVADLGQPGTNDTFAIQLSNGYVAGGNLGGGNIKLHTCE